jgi:hypothetical protein
MVGSHTVVAARTASSRSRVPLSDVAYLAAASQLRVMCTRRGTTHEDAAWP